jgi:hypothetical protein
MAKLDMHAHMAEFVGYVDGQRGFRPDTRILDSEYRRDYLTGFLLGQHNRAGETDSEASEVSERSVVDG